VTARETLTRLAEEWERHVRTLYAQITEERRRGDQFRGRADEEKIHDLVVGMRCYRECAAALRAALGDGTGVTEGEDDHAAVRNAADGGAPPVGDRGHGVIAAASPLEAPRGPDERVKKGFRLGVEAAARCVENFGDAAACDLAAEIRELAPAAPSSTESDALREARETIEAMTRDWAAERQKAYRSSQPEMAEYLLTCEAEWRKTADKLNRACEERDALRSRVGALAARTEEDARKFGEAEKIADGHEPGAGARLATARSCHEAFARDLRAALSGGAASVDKKGGDQ
jgi:hypothetical protein